MVHNKRRVGTDAEDAAQILRGYRERIERLEEEKGAGSDAIQLYRQVSETVVCTDTISTSTQTGGFEWNTSKWGFAEWEDN